MSWLLKDIQWYKFQFIEMLSIAEYLGKQYERSCILLPFVILF